MTSHRRASLALALSLALFAAPAFAVSSIEYNAGLQFNFSNPGARSLGMGGAYLGFSDDATAAYTNPAGLTVLSQPEFAVEYRSTRYNTPFVAGSTGTNSVFESESRSRVNTPTYFAAVYPGDRWAVALYRNVELDFENVFEKGSIPVTFPGLPAGVFVRPAGSAIDAESINWGLSGAYEFNDRWSVGLSAVYTQFELRAASVRAENNVIVFTQTEFADENEFTYNLGLFYKASDKMSIGLAYRRGAEFDTFLRATDGVNPDLTGVGAFNIPHQIGLGLAYRATDNFSVGFDAHYVDYDTLSEDPLRVESDSKVFFDSGVELRLGAEYVFSQFENPFTIRAGVWRDPDHRFAFEGTPETAVQFVDSLLFPRGESEMHYTVGFGWALKRFQFDFGADISDPIKTYSVSGVIRF